MTLSGTNRKLALCAGYRGFPKIIQNLFVILFKPKSVQIHLQIDLSGELQTE